MLHSTVTKRGQTTLPSEVRSALGIKTGDRLVYEIQHDRLTVRVHPGIGSLAGALASTKGKGLSFQQIRRRAAADAIRNRKQSK